MDTEELKNRTKQFSLRVIGLVESLPNTRTSNMIGNQLLRSGTSVGEFIVQLAEGVQALISSRKSALPLKKRTNHFIGWKFSSNRGFFRRTI